MSDSPPEKDIQWSEEGIISSYKFIQKLWNLNSKVLNEINKNHSQDHDENLKKETNRFLKKITENLENFSYNKIIANLYEIYGFLIKKIEKNYKRKTIVENYEKILIAIMPVIPHFSNECLEIIKTKNFEWPAYDVSLLEDDNIIMVIQINGKKRGLIEAKRNVSEKDVLDIVMSDTNINKYIENKEIKKKIFVKNKLINIII